MASEPTRNRMLVLPLTLRTESFILLAPFIEMEGRPRPDSFSPGKSKTDRACLHPTAPAGSGGVGSNLLIIGRPSFRANSSIPDLKPQVT
jgi:hypothetical protein